MTPALPHLDIVETMSDFDEALIMIDGHEEETIRIECVGSRELAEQIIELVRIARCLQDVSQRSEA